MSKMKTREPQRLRDAGGWRDSVVPLIFTLCTLLRSTNTTPPFSPTLLISIHTDDFDVSIFLTELSTPHSILTRQKLFDPKTERIKSNSGKMTGTRDDPMNIDEGEGVLLREERQEEGKVDLGDIPPAAAAAAAEAEIEAEAGGRQEKLFVSDSEDDDDLDNSGSDDEDGFQTQAAPPKRPKASNTTSLTNPTESKDDKKKMGLKTSYDGFRIYGRILCLVVKRKGGRGAVEGGAGGGGGGGKGKEMMEQFISTQLQNEGVGAGE